MPSHAAMLTSLLRSSREKSYLAERMSRHLHTSHITSNQGEQQERGIFEAMESG